MDSTNAWLRAGAPIVSGRGRRIAAAALELAPLIPLAVQFSPLTPRDAVTPLWVLAFTTGLGWALAGRWRVGVLIAAGRVGVLWAGMYALIIFSFGGGCSLGDEGCDGGWPRALAQPLLWGLGIFFVATVLASAWFAQRAAARTAERDSDGDGR